MMHTYLFSNLRMQNGNQACKSFAKRAEQKSRPNVQRSGNELKTVRFRLMCAQGLEKIWTQISTRKIKTKTVKSRLSEFVGLVHSAPFLR